MTVIEKLEAAKIAIQDLHDTLNLRLSGTPCHCCGLTLRDSLDDHNASKELTSVIAKLDRYQIKIENGEWHGRGPDGVRSDSAGTLRRKVAVGSTFKTGDLNALGGGASAAPVSRCPAP